MSEQPLSVYDLTQGRIVAKRFEVMRPHRQGGLSTAFEVRDRETDDRCEMQLFPSGCSRPRARPRSSPPPGRPGCASGRRRCCACARSVPLGALEPDPDHGLPRGRRAARPAQRAQAPARGRVRAPRRAGARGARGGSTPTASCTATSSPYTIHVRGDGARPCARRWSTAASRRACGPAKHLGEKTAPDRHAVLRAGGAVRRRLADGAVRRLQRGRRCSSSRSPAPCPGAGVSFLEVFQAKLDKRPPSLRRTRARPQVRRGLEEAIAIGCLAERSAATPRRASSATGWPSSCRSSPGLPIRPQVRGPRRADGWPRRDLREGGRAIGEP
jgi:hypothetical protein